MSAIEQTFHILLIPCERLLGGAFRRCPLVHGEIRPTAGRIECEFGPIRFAVRLMRAFSALTDDGLIQSGL
jgi:hypothetical protein